MPFSLEDTIVAISTPLGPSPVAVLRLSGAAALDHVLAHVRTEDRAALTTIKGFGQLAVEWVGEEVSVPARVTLFRSPKSYTGEDLVEVLLPGSIPLLAMFLRALLTAGASRDPPDAIRLAGPGEYTLRAFLHGKMDLSQAEAVGRLIHATSGAETHAAYRQVVGALREKIENLGRAITELLALVEAGIDFPDEELPAVAPETLGPKLAAVQETIDTLLANTSLRIPERGTLRVALLGLPNAGKSSLLNAMVGRPVALVSEFSGTTRDPVRAFSGYRGRQLEWVDLAGFEETTWLPEELITLGPPETGLRSRRDGAQPIDFAGAIQRLSQRERDSADLCLWLTDGTAAAVSQERNRALPWPGDLAGQKPSRSLVVVTKCDLIGQQQRQWWVSRPEKPVLTSAVTGEGLKTLLDRILQEAEGEARPVGHAARPEESGTFLLSPLQEAQLIHCSEALRRTAFLLSSGAGYELVAVDLREALLALAPLSGREVSGRVLGAIFAQFCIGK